VLIGLSYRSSTFLVNLGGFGLNCGNTFGTKHDRPSLEHQDFSLQRFATRLNMTGFIGVAIAM